MALAIQHLLEGKLGACSLVARVKPPDAKSGDKETCTVKRVILLAFASFSFLAKNAYAENTQGYGRDIPLGPDIGSIVNLPEIKLPQPEWRKEMSIYATDGTSKVPSCGTPKVVNEVKIGILSTYNQKSRLGSGNRYDLFTGIKTGPVWVHDTYDDRQVCSMEITLALGGDDKILQSEKWIFETFSDDGRGRVFFYCPTAMGNSR